VAGWGPLSSRRVEAYLDPSRPMDGGKAML